MIAQLPRGGAREQIARVVARLGRLPAIGADLSGWRARACWLPGGFVEEGVLCRFNVGIGQRRQAQAAYGLAAGIDQLPGPGRTALRRALALHGGGNTQSIQVQRRLRRAFGRVCRLLAAQAGKQGQPLHAHWRRLCLCRHARRQQR